MSWLLLEFPGGAGGFPTQWAAVALGILTIIYVVVIRPMRKGRMRRDPLERPARLGTLAQQRAVERDMGNLLVEYEEMIRRMTAQVDTRAAKLELLIKDAEDAIARLTAAGAPAGGAAPATTRSADVAATAPPPSQADGDGTSGADAVSEASPVSQAAAATLAGEAGADGDRPDRRHDEVYRLADAAKSAHDIAKTLGRPYGEIELILALRGDRRPTEPEAADEPAGAESAPEPAPQGVPVSGAAPDAHEMVLPTLPVPAAPPPTVPGAAERMSESFRFPNEQQGRRGRKQHRSQRP